ncbi:hypothetical protein [Carnobacterium divergens]|uniref:hypothetical protein n=1 Tax=Carnobacterium divergens TaxID=2748 RepID=UPI0007F40E06|nr:hypothetical protein [Carnobacterium divergens]SBO17441.1 hypothetical protein CDIV41_320002 [Carnobacterium divergens]
MTELNKLITANDFNNEDSIMIHQFLKNIYFNEETTFKIDNLSKEGKEKFNLLVLDFQTPQD